MLIRYAYDAYAAFADAAAVCRDAVTTPAYHVAMLATSYHYFRRKHYAADTLRYADYTRCHAAIEIHC